MKPNYVVALDQGTTSSRTIIFDQDGKIVAVAQKEYQQIYPQPGWVEHDPLEIWSSQSSTLVEALTKHQIETSEVAAIGITNQRETVVVWEKATGKPICNAIVWQDRRTAGMCSRLRGEGLEPEFASRSGLRLDPYFSGTKLSWILSNVHGARARAERGELLFGTVDSWLIWKLTDGRVHATDFTNASRTLLFNVHTGKWDDELLRILDIPHSMLPEVRSCSEVYGEAKGGVPIAGVAGDQQAALFGQACFQPGMAKNTYGTGCFLLMNTGTKAVPSQNNLLTTVAWRLNGETHYALEGSIFIGGAVIQWLRDEMNLIETAAECDALAASVSDANGAFLVPAFAGLGAPHWDPYARGVCVGLTRGVSRAHFCRAALESIALQSADLVASMEADSGMAITSLKVDGGASRSDPLLQFQADLLGIPVVRPKCVETTALGAAYLAGLAVGVWTDKQDIVRTVAPDRVFEPERPRDEMQNIRLKWNGAVERAKGWAPTE